MSDFWRRRAGGILLSLGLLAAAIGYSGMILRGIVTDDGIATSAADAALRDDRVQAFLAEQTSSAIAEQLLGLETVESLRAFGIDPTEDLDAVATALVDDSRFAEAFSGAVRTLHRQVFVESGPTPVIDVTVLVTLARNEAVARNPAYAALFPPDGTLRVAVPADELPDLTGVTQAIGNRARAATVVAAALVAAGMIVHSARPAGLRRIGTWAITTAAVQAAIALALPVVAARLPGDLRGVAEAAAHVLRPRLLVPAAMLGAVGAALVVAAWRWKRADDGAHEQLGARAFLGSDPFETAAAFDGSIELATHRSPMAAPPVPLTTGHDDQFAVGFVVDHPVRDPRDVRPTTPAVG